MIQLINVSKTFTVDRKQQKELQLETPIVHAVKDLSFTCQPGRVMGLLGPNGAGKTTTLRMIATMIQPSTGTVIVNNIDTKTDNNTIRKNLGFLTGSTGLYMRLTPNELLDYFAGIYALPKNTYLQRRDELYTLLGMNEFANKQIGKFSTGMKQKVSIVRTILHDPPVVVFDEPTSGLDVITSENIIELIQSCKKQNKTVIFSSHIMNEIDLLCDDLVIMNKGKICFNNTMENFRNTMPATNITQSFISIVKNHST